MSYKLKVILPVIGMLLLFGCAALAVMRVTRSASRFVAQIKQPGIGQI